MWNLFAFSDKWRVFFPVIPRADLDGDSVYLMWRFCRELFYDMLHGHDGGTDTRGYRISSTRSCCGGALTASRNRRRLLRATAPVCGLGKTCAMRMIRQGRRIWNPPTDWPHRWVSLLVKRWAVWVACAFFMSPWAAHGVCRLNRIPRMLRYVASFLADSLWFHLAELKCAKAQQVECEEHFCRCLEG